MNTVSDTVIEFQGLTVVQVSQNQAAVVSDPQVCFRPRLKLNCLINGDPESSFRRY